MVEHMNGELEASPYGRPSGGILSNIFGEIFDEIVGGNTDNGSTDDSGGQQTENDWFEQNSELGEQIGAIISGVTGKTGEDFDALNESAYDAIYGVVNDSDFLLKDKVLEVLEDHSGRNETGWSGTLSAKAGGDCLSGWLADWLRPGVDANGG